jgi:hypothetical protein
VPSASNGSALDRLVDELAEPVARLGGDDWSAARLEQLLARTELRAWRVQDAGEPGVLIADCPLGTGRALLACARAPEGELVRGAFVVGHAVPFGPNRYLLVGRVTVVGRARAARFAAQIASLKAPRGEFWRVHGAVLAREARAIAA